VIACYIRSRSGVCSFCRRKCVVRLAYCHDYGLRDVIACRECAEEIMWRAAQPPRISSAGAGPGRLASP
jgi:hypothetical protein